MEKIEYRSNPKIWFKETIKAPDNKRLDIGHFVLVVYFTKDNLPHIEFEIYEEFKQYRNRGIVSKEIVKYLKFCRRWGHKKLIAIVKEDNIASIKVLEKNNFIRVNQFKENICFVIDLECTKEKLMAMQQAINQREIYNNQFKKYR